MVESSPLFEKRGVTFWSNLVEITKTSFPTIDTGGLGKKKILTDY
jgi:hypothetical protein